MAADILSAVEPVRALVGGLDPRNVPLPWAPEVLAAFVEMEHALRNRAQCGDVVPALTPIPAQA